MNDNPLVSVVIPNWNGNRYIANCIDSVIQQTLEELEIIVFDNASKDGSNYQVKENYPIVKLIENKNNIGFARANNKAVKAASGDYILLINNDTILDPDCVEHLYSFYQINDCACVTGKMVFPDRKTIDHAGGIYSRIGIALDRGLLNKDENQYNDPIKIDYAHGSCVFMKRDLYLKIGGFDSDFFQFVEDVDLGLKLKSLGHDIYYCPSAKMVHYDGGTTGRENRRRTKFMVTNLAATMFKNYKLFNLIFFFPLFIASRLTLGIAYLLKRRFDLFLGVLEGIVGMPASIRLALAKRKELHKLGHFRTFRSEFGFVFILKESLHFFFNS